MDAIYFFTNKMTKNAYITFHSTYFVPRSLFKKKKKSQFLFFNSDLVTDNLLNNRHFTARLALGWRIRLTKHLLEIYMKNNAFYKVPELEVFYPE